MIHRSPKTMLAPPNGAAKTTCRPPGPCTGPRSNAGSLENRVTPEPSAWAVHMSPWLADTALSEEAQNRTVCPSGAHSGLIGVTPSTLSRASVVRSVPSGRIL